MSQSARPTATGNGIPIVQPASSTPTPRPNVRRVAPAAATQPTVSLAEHEALKRRLDATEAMVNALVAGSQPRSSKRPKFPKDNNLRLIIRRIYADLEWKFTFPASMQSDANLPVFDAIVRRASESDYFRRNFCDAAGALRPSKRPQVMAAVTVHYDYQRSKWNESKLGVEVQKKIALEKKYRARKDRKLARRLAQYEVYKEGQVSELRTDKEYLAFLEPDCMSEEEDGDMVNDVAVNIRLVVPSWRSEELNKFLKELDDLHKKAYPDAVSRPRNPVHSVVPLTSELRSRIFAWGIAPFH